MYSSHTNSFIAISSKGCISALGSDDNEIDLNLQQTKSYISFQDKIPVGKISEENLALLNPTFSNWDKSVQFALFAAQKAFKYNEGKKVGICVGSSRGATELFETFHNQFLNSNSRISPFTSPLTTLGNLSSSIAKVLQIKGPILSHSSTCSTSIQSILNGIAWLKANMADIFLVGGSEAPLTPFTIAQMQALKIYSKENQGFPCKPFSKTPQNTMVLGEGACIFQIEKFDDLEEKKYLGLIKSYGVSFENSDTLTGMSKEGIGFQEFMNQCIEQNIKPDLIIAHAPGTILGDNAEYNAIKEVFGDKIPIISSKWIFGHTLGASGALSVDLALRILKNQQIPEFPYPTFLPKTQKPAKIENILINAAGFGGVTTSLMIGNSLRTKS